METIRVNMTPCEDTKTIHASQNDNEAREWGFELHNNGEKIDSSSISDQMVFKAYEGGTEEILPTNGSTPTTSPFKGDIKYPQGLLSDQEFLYRESPTEEDGLAKITDIKGNTLVWNQLVQNGNFADTSVWQTVSGASFTVSGNVANVTSTSAYGRIRQFINFISGHKYLIFADVKKSNANDGIRLYYGTQLGGGSYIFENNTNWQKLAIIKTATSSESSEYPNVEPTADNITWQQRNMMIIDLTQMFGAGNEPTSVAEFTKLFPLPYYAYNQGTLLSFMGNGIKTVGKNLVFKTIPSSTISGGGAIISTSNFQMSVARVIKGKEYVITTNDNSKKVLGFYYEEPSVGSVSYNGERVDDSSSYTFTSPITGYVAFRSLDGYSTPMLEFGTSATSYEPYTSSTLSLPISTYFPSGMKSAGNVYDELTESKAITRIGSVDLGTLSFFYNSSSSFFYATIPDLVNGMTYATESPNVIVQNFEYKGGGVGWANMPNMSYGFNGQDIRIKNTAYTSSAEFVRAVSGTYMLYELATYEETSFTTASLVTENGEIPLSNEDGVLIGKCTEQLSSDSGFFDAKIKLADEDGECYSNKIQLHVERSPQ